MSNKCTICGKELTGQQKLFCSQACHRVKRNEKQFEVYYQRKAENTPVSCTICGIRLYGKQTKFCSKDCRDEFYAEKRKAEAALKKIPKRKKCEVCGKSFKNNQSNNKKYCSAKCRNFKSQEIIKLAKAQMPRVQKHCEMCNCLFFADSRAGTRQKYCGHVCSDFATKKRNQTYKGKYVQKYYCKMCKKLIEKGSRAYCESCIEIRKAEKQEFAVYKRVCTDCKKSTNNHRCPPCLAAHKLKHGVEE